VSAAEVPHRFSVEEFIAFCDTDPDRYTKYELIDGEIWEPMSESDRHAKLVEDIADSLKRTMVGRVRSHGSVILAGDGMSLPDVFVVREGEVLAPIIHGAEMARGT
jgi:Uma2 family endonuclease